MPPQVDIPPPLPLDDQTAVHIFTAAAYSGKTKTGGWATVLIYGEHESVLHDQVPDTTANRMQV